MTNILIAAATSGSGKTTFTMGLLRALKKRGMNVQPFKCGPDYIDTKWHTLASGRESVNLDIWLSSRTHVRELFQAYGHDADACVTEGAMGMFDGFNRWHGSSSDVAQTIGAKVILVVNAKSTAYSVAPIIYGFKNFNKHIDIAGVVFNQVASQSHYKHLEEACNDAGVECFGFMGKSKEIELPSRHLGLTIDERFRIDAFIDKAALIVEQTVDVDRIIKACYTKPANQDTTLLSFPQTFPFFPNLHPKHIAIAQDEAFNFTYRANIDFFRNLADKVTFFSPMTDESLPPHTDLLYLPGGYPEFFLSELSSNSKMVTSISRYIEEGGHAFAECGGMLYLCKNIIDMDDTPYDMAGILDIKATFKGMKLHLGYRKMEINKCDVIHSDGCDSSTTLYGHEFHYSDIESIGNGIATAEEQRSAKNERTSTKLFRYKNLIAGYTHFYWAAKPK